MLDRGPSWPPPNGVLPSGSHLHTPAQEPGWLRPVVTAAEGGSQQLCQACVFISTLRLREVKALAQGHTAPEGQHHDAPADGDIRGESL